MRLRLSRLDALLVVMTLIWGSNYSIIKSAIREIPPIGFTSLRLLIASALFLSSVAVRSRFSRNARNSRSDGLNWAGIVGLAVVGQTVYQLLFISGLARTTVANSSLIVGCTPIFIALFTAMLGHERIPPARWAGVSISALGVYTVVGYGATVNRQSIAGDLMMLGSVVCWSLTAVGSRPLLARHSPLVVTGYSMAIGTILFLPFGWSDLRHLAWAGVSTGSWLALIVSAVAGLYVAYIIWYTALQRIGSTRTSVYSNVVPIVAMLCAWLFLGEEIGVAKAAGAAAVILGVALSKLEIGEAPGAEVI